MQNIINAIRKTCYKTTSHKTTKYLILCILGLFVSIVSAGCGKKNEMKVHCFNAGKADAFLITTTTGTILIDTGEDDEGDVILAYLKQAKITTIDYLIITHFDKDHVGGADKVIENITIHNVIQSDSPKDSADYREYIKALDDRNITADTLRETLTFTVDNVSVSIYPPEKTTYKKNESNNSSLVVRMVHGDNSFLFAADAQDARLSELIKMGNLQSTFLKVPYHGIYQDNLEDFLKMVNPAYAVITSSETQLEDKETVEILEKLGTKVYLTRQGDVSVTSDGKKIKITQ